MVCSAEGLTCSEADDESLAIPKALLELLNTKLLWTIAVDVDNWYIVLSTHWSASEKLIRDEVDITSYEFENVKT